MVACTLIGNLYTFRSFPICKSGLTDAVKPLVSQIVAKLYGFLVLIANCTSCECSMGMVDSSVLYICCQKSCVTICNQYKKR